MAVSTKSTALFVKMRLFAPLRMIIAAGVSSIGCFEPFETKNIANLIAESNSEILRAGLEIRPLQIISHRLRW